MEQKKLTKADLRKVFLRSLTIMCSWNYERQMHMGFMCGMSPVLDKLWLNRYIGDMLIYSTLMMSI